MQPCTTAFTMQHESGGKNSNATLAHPISEQVYKSDCKLYYVGLLQRAMHVKAVRGHKFSPHTKNDKQKSSCHTTASLIPASILILPDSSSNKMPDCCKKPSASDTCYNLVCICLFYMIMLMVSQNLKKTYWQAWK